MKTFTTPIENKLSLLSEREKEVLLLVLEEKTSVEIGTIMNISPHTVRTHRTSINRKLGNISFRDKVTIAQMLGLIIL